MGKSAEFLEQNIFSIEYQSETDLTKMSHRYFQIKIKDIITGKRILGLEEDMVSQLI